MPTASQKRRPAMNPFPKTLSACLLAGAAWAQAPQVEPEIRTLLERACVSCHSGAQTAGGLSLDSAAGVTKGGKSGAVVAPGNAGASALFQRVVSSDRAVRM